MSNATLTIMCGLARSGKSTWIKNNRGSAVVVSPDSIRKEMFGHQFHAPANQFVFGVAEGMATLILKQGIDVIVDATNINVETRAVWRRLAERNNANYTIVWVYSDKNRSKNLAECLERNVLSPIHERLPVKALANMALYFEAPHGHEGAQIVQFRNVHKRDAALSKRININKTDSIFDVEKKWREIWDVAENQEPTLKPT